MKRTYNQKRIFTLSTNTKKIESDRIEWCGVVCDCAAEADVALLFAY